MNIEEFKKHPSYIYAIDSIANEDIPKYVKKQCKEFLEIVENYDSKNYKWTIDLKLVSKIDKILELIYFSSGIKVGTPIAQGLASFQFFFIINVLCVKYKNDINKRRYEKAVLLIGRKSGKSFLIGLIFKLLMLLDSQSFILLLLIKNYRK